MNKKHLSFFFIILSTTFIILPAFTTSIPSVLAIQLGTDDTIEKSTAILKKNFPNLKVVSFDSMEFSIKIHRKANLIIWIGHGNNDYIKLNDQRVSWEDFSKFIKKTPSYDIVLSCYSSSLIKITSITSEEALTINGEIDGVLGALMISYLYNPSFTLAKEIVSHRRALFDRKVNFMPLSFMLDPGEGGDSEGQDFDIPYSYEEIQERSDEYIFAKCSGAELSYWVIISVILLIEIVFLFTIDVEEWDFITKAIIKIYTTGLVVSFCAVVMAGINAMSAEEIAIEMGDIFIDVGGLLWNAFTATTTAEKIAWGALCGLSILTQIIIHVADALGAAGLATTLRVAASILLVASWVTGFTFDITDDDVVIG